MKQPKESTGSTSSAAEKPTIEYTVRDRDTLTSIAARFHSTPSELCLMNRRSNRIVFPGMRLLVPDPEAAAAAAAAASAAAASLTKSHSQSQSESSNFSSTSTNGEDDDGDGDGDGDDDVLLLGAASEPKPQPPPPEDPHERKFIKAKVRLMTRGEGVVSGTLLVTPNTVLFDPNVSDPLVIEHGPDAYSVTHPLGHVMALNAYASPELMALRREDRPGAAAAAAGEYALSSAGGGSAATPTPTPSSSSFGAAMTVGSFLQQQQQQMVDLSCGLFSTQRHDLRPVADLSRQPAQLAADRLQPHTCTQFEDQPLYLCVSLKPRAVGASGRAGSRRRRAGAAASASRMDELWFTVARRDADSLHAFLRSCGAAAAGGVAVSADQSESPSGQDDDYYFVQGAGAAAAAAAAMVGSWQLVCADQASFLLPRREDLPLPRLLGGRSRLLNRRRLRHLVKALPPRAECLNLRLLFAASRHGFSLKGAYRACASSVTGVESDAYCLLLVLDTEGHLFGAFLTGCVRPSEHYYGTGETFVFRWSRLVQPLASSSGSGGAGRASGSSGGDNCQFSVEGDDDGGGGSTNAATGAGAGGNASGGSSDGSSDDSEDEAGGGGGGGGGGGSGGSDFYQYAWTGENTYFLRGATDAFTVGSCRGRCAIWLDAGLYRGRSQPCDTFNSPVLCGAREDFLVRELEVWAFADPTGDG